MFVTTLRQNRNNILDDFIDEVLTSHPFDYRHSNSSHYKTELDDDGILLTMNVPGYNKKLIDVSVSGDQLTLEGKSHTGSTEGFNHTFTLDTRLDSNEIDATVIDGVLTVSIPYAEAVKPRKIEVKVK